MKKICWIQHASEWPLYIPLAKALKTHGVESIFVCKTKTVYDKYKTEGLDSYFLSEIFTHKNRLDDASVKQLESKYGSPGINHIGDSDVQIKALFEGDEAGKRQLIAQAYLFWEKFFDDNKDIYVIARETATFATRTAYLVAKQREIPYGWIDYGPTDNTFVICDQSEFFIWSELDIVAKAGPRLLNAQEQKVVNQYLSLFSENELNAKPIRFIPDNIFKSVKALCSYTLNSTSKNKHRDPIRVGALIFGRKKLLKRLNWLYLTQFFFKYDPLKSDEPYVYFPVYSGEEAGYLTVEHFWARNQMALIKEVAQSLPVGYTLCVKEHPWNPGEFTFSQLKELKKIANIRIVNPRTSGQTLIKNSEAVVVLQSFTGWEAYVNKKPVVVLGQAFYTFSSLFYRVSTITELSKILWRALDKNIDIYADKQSEWLWSIYTVITSAHPGMFVNKKPPYGFPDDKENAKIMAEAIAKKIAVSKDLLQ